MPMKFLALLFISSLAMGAPPEYLRGGKIDVKTRDGITHKFSSDKWLVANRAVSDRYHEGIRRRMAELRSEIARLKSRKPEKENLRHNLSLNLGYGLIGIELEREGDGVVAFQNYGPIAGLTYSYRFTDHYTVSVQALTSSAFVGAMGYSW
jgi:hypothetical protein